MKVCLIIPLYNHGREIVSLLQTLASYELPCLVVDDGSDAATKQILQGMLPDFPWVSVVTLSVNQGKGGAVMAGLKAAAAKNYTHAIQIDADGQHDPTDIPKFLTAIKNHPTAFIAGQPLYDGSIPKGRLYGRKITNFWVRIETLSTAIKDAMCGYRAYPVRLTSNIINKNRLGKRMDFDIEIAVRLCWEGCEVVTIPTKVRYPEEGCSHFKLWRDNLAISWLHTRLFFGMLWRLKRPRHHHWSRITEKGSILGMKFLLFIYKLLGRKITGLMLYPVIGYFYLTSRKARRSSRKYLDYVKGARVNPDTFSPGDMNVYRHFMAFADSILDKMAVWNGKIGIEEIDFENLQLILDLARRRKGAIIFTAHLGNMEVARALARYDPAVKMTVLLYHRNAEKINSILKQVNPDFSLDVIYLDSPGIGLAMQLQGKIDAGELIVVACDRISVSRPERNLPVSFLQHQAFLPQGPFVLAGLLQCPVYFMLCLKENGGRFTIVFEKFASVVALERRNRSRVLQLHAERYAQLLESYCVKYPLQWFNFFDFWCTRNLYD